MQITLRLPLPDNSSLSRVPVQALDSAFYSWRHKARRFVFERGTTFLELPKVIKLARAMRVTVEDEKEPVLSPMIPPQKPVYLAAWERGFGKRTRRRDLEAAREEAQMLQMSDRGRYRFIMHDKFVFVFEPPALKHAELRSILWAVAPGIGVHDVKPVLRQHCRM